MTSRVSLSDSEWTINADMPDKYANEQSVGCKSVSVVKCAVRLLETVLHSGM